MKKEQMRLLLRHQHDLSQWKAAPPKEIVQGVRLPPTRDIRGVPLVYRRKPFYYLLQVLSLGVFTEIYSGHGMLLSGMQICVLASLASQPQD